VGAPFYLHLATSQMWCWSGGRGILKKKLSLCYSIVYRYYYNGAQRCEQFLQVGQMYQALILLGWALCLPNFSVCVVFNFLEASYCGHFHVFHWWHYVNDIDSNTLIDNVHCLFCGASDFRNTLNFLFHVCNILFTRSIKKFVLWIMQLMTC